MNIEAESGVVAIPAWEGVIYLPSAIKAQQERDVERINSFSFYGVGKAFKTIEELPEDVSTTVQAGHLFWTLHSAITPILNLLNGQPIPLGISRDKAVAFHGSLTSLFDGHFTEDDGKGGRKMKFPDQNTPAIPAWEFWQVKRALTEFETVFAEEMKEAATYYVPRRGIFWTPALVDTADEAFPLSLRGHIPQKTKDDWKAAGRCLAFNLLSASGFHAARAVEGTLEAYYQLFSGQPGVTLKNWHDYKTELDKIAAKNPTPAPNPKTLAELDQMRQDYRNPIMHPRVVLTEPDARMLFANGESLIIAMAQEICDARSQGGVQLALAQNATAAIGQGTGSGAGAATQNATNTATP